MRAQAHQAVVLVKDSASVSSAAQLEEVKLANIFLCTVLSLRGRRVGGSGCDELTFHDHGGYDETRGDDEVQRDERPWEVEGHRDVQG